MSVVNNVPGASMYCVVGNGTALGTLEWANFGANLLAAAAIAEGDSSSRLSSRIINYIDPVGVDSGPVLNFVGTAGGGELDVNTASVENWAVINGEDGSEALDDIASTLLDVFAVAGSGLTGPFDSGTTYVTPQEDLSATLQANVLS